MEGPYLLGHLQQDQLAQLPRQHQMVVLSPSKEEQPIRQISRAQLHHSLMVEHSNNSSHLLILSLNRQETQLKTGLASTTIHNSRLILQTKSKNRVQLAVRSTRSSHYKHYLVQTLALRIATTFDLYKMTKKGRLRTLLKTEQVEAVVTPPAHKISLELAY